MEVSNQRKKKLSKNKQNQLGKNIKILSSILIISLTSFSGCLSDYIPRTGKLLINEIYNSDNVEKHWLEIYNPHDYTVSLSLYEFYYGACQSPKGPHTKLKEHSYIILCKDKKVFLDNFKVPKDVEIFEYDNGFSDGQYHYGISLNDASDSDIVFVVREISEGNNNFLHRPPREYSLSRYGDGYDTDKDVNDFYYEPNPTPGWENNRVKSLGDT